MSDSKMSDSKPEAPLEGHLPFMRLALEEAQKALEVDEVPVGAVIVSSANEVVARAYNRKEQDQRATAHAEILALEKACQSLGAWRLTEHRIYVTLEPCLMCCGALLQSRICQVIFGAADPKAGACSTLYQTLSDTRLNHQASVVEGVLAEESRALLKGFFEGKRNRNKKFS